MHAQLASYSAFIATFARRKLVLLESQWSFLVVQKLLMSFCEALLGFEFFRCFLQTLSIYLCDLCESLIKKVYYYSIINTLCMYVITSAHWMWNQFRPVFSSIWLIVVFEPTFICIPLFSCLLGLRFSFDRKIGVKVIFCILLFILMFLLKLMCSFECICWDDKSFICWLYWAHVVFVNSETICWAPI